MKIAPIYVDSWTIAVMKLNTNECLIDWAKFLETINNWYWFIKEFTEWIYTRKIKNTRNGNIEWKVHLYDWLYYVWDPCYIIKKNWRDSFIWDYLCDEDSKTTKKMLENRKIYDINIIDSMWWDWDYVLLLTKTK
jgi:hypothetical protein